MRKTKNEPLTVENSYFKKIEDALHSDYYYNHFVFYQGTIENNLDRTIDRIEESGGISSEQLRLIKHFFKTKSAIDKLKEFSEHGFSIERKVLFQTNYSMRRKKEHLNELILIFRNILGIVFTHTEFEVYSEENFKKLEEKLMTKGDLKFIKQISLLHLAFHRYVSEQIGIGAILTDEEFAIHWAKFYTGEIVEHKISQIIFDMDEKEIKLYHLYSFQFYWAIQINSFASNFRDEFRFSFQGNVAKLNPILVKEPYPGYAGQTDHLRPEQIDH